MRSWRVRAENVPKQSGPTAATQVRVCSGAVRKTVSPTLRGADHSQSAELRNDLFCAHSPPARPGTGGARGYPALLPEVAALIRDPRHRRLAAVGPVTVSQLGTAGLVAGGGARAAALARELAAEWPDSEQAEFQWLMTSAGITWAP